MSTQFDGPPVVLDDEDTGALVTPPRMSEEEQIRGWRFTRAVGQGFDEEQASRIAEDASIDQHLIDRLLAAGCDLELALRIV